VVALDYGRSRIGVAASDPTRTIASPHSAISNRGAATEPPAELIDLLGELEPAVIVLGIPLQMDGTEGPMALEAREFGVNLGAATGIRVVEWDERLTSAAAERTLRETGAPRRKRREKGSVDRLAAAVMLRAYLASGR
jgi:putative Holliday junction resolvase